MNANRVAVAVTTVVSNDADNLDSLSKNKESRLLYMAAAGPMSVFLLME